MKVAISLPDPLFRAAEALAAYVGTHAGHNITQRLNAIYATEPSRPDPAWNHVQARVVSLEAW